jgi:23S rRNA pseudouridine1911/1915/1917 synthase
VIGTASSDARAYALVRCDLETGRQHQIRVHLAAVGCPVVGDKLYGPDPELFARGVDGTLTEDDRAILELDRHALHAHKLALDHPITGDRLAIEAPLPTDLTAFWASLGSTSGGA